MSATRLPRPSRGADVLVSALKRAGVTHIFALSGNHIMSVFDALLGSGIEIIHTRHEAACVHMADAYARLTGRIGVALVTGGQGFTNAAAGLPTALSADSPVLLLSGDTPTREIGRGSFQELAQADMSRPVTKDAFRAASPDDLGDGILRAISTAMSGRPGPVHVALPSDLLDAPSTLAVSASAARLARSAEGNALTPIVDLIQAAHRPILLAGPMFARDEERVALARFETQTHIPALIMESPRGLNDPAHGAFADVLLQADLIVLLSKPLDFTLRFGAPPAISAHTRFVMLDPDETMIARAVRERPGQVAASLHADPNLTLYELGANLQPGRDAGWLREVCSARDHRPAAWAGLKGGDGALHPVELCRAVQDVVARDHRAVFIADGGEIGQWAQACITAPRRVINGVAGSIGASIPFALAARITERDAPVLAVMGDGTFGFHMAEFDTAVRHNLPFVAVVGNDCAWNAEHQIQLRTYGAQRAHGCTLLPTRYDQVVAALGGHGEHVTKLEELAPAIARAHASGKPACVNVMIESHAAPVVRRG